jgi:hypothetical protein
MKNYPQDYLKFWRVINYYFRNKHNLTPAELDTILFLYSEKYFDKGTFSKYNQLLRWDVTRFQKLVDEGWIDLFRVRTRGHKNVYQVSSKGVNMCRDIYRKLNGEEIPTSLSHNAMIKKNVSYFDKVYRNMIKEMNASIKLQRRRTPE